MKKILVTMILILVFATAFALKNWTSYTNTTHVYDAEVIDGKIYLATWGGLSIFNHSNKQYESVYTTSNGLVANDLRSISQNEVLDQTFIGTRNSGIERLSANSFLPTLETNDNISKIICSDSLTFVSNRDGISLYKIISSWPIPVLWDTYSNDSGLSSTRVNDFVVTDSGYLLVATESGFDVVKISLIDNPSAWQHYNISNSDLPSNLVLAVAEKDGKVLLGTNSGLVEFNLDEIDNSWNASELGRSILAVYIDANNDNWYSFGLWDNDLLQVIEQEEVGIKRTGSSTTEWNSADFSNSAALGFIEVEKNIYAYFWGEGIYQYTDGEWISYKDNNISASVVKSLTMDKTGNLWVSNGYLSRIGNPPLPRGTKGVSKFDGTDWTTYNFDNSGMNTNNIFTLAVDHDNDIWMGAWWADNNPLGWDDGISILDQSADSWTILKSNDGLRNNAIGGITIDDQNRAWVSCVGGSNGGISVLDENHEVLADFELYDSYSQNSDPWNDPRVTFIGQDALYFGGGKTGLRIWKNWNGSNYPVDNGSNWEVPAADELEIGRIYTITSMMRNGLEEIWVGSVNGLFQYAFNNGNSRNDPGYYWFRYSPHIKRSVYWINEFNSLGWYDTANAFYFYIEGQERLYAGELTFPTAMLIDPFGIIWIGTSSNGVTMYDPDRDVFKTYNKANSPLISNSVTDLAYDEITGIMYIGTDDGLSSVQIGISSEFNTEKNLKSTIAFPNPFKPGNGEILRIENKDKLTMPKGNTKCYIYDLNGNLVRNLAKDSFEQFSWDGNNEAGKECASGIYFYVVSTSDGQTDRGKIALIR